MPRPRPLRALAFGKDREAIRHHPNLNARQLAFVNAIVLGKTGTEAAIIAGYSVARARYTASGLLATNRNVQAAIAERRLAVSERVGKTADDISRAAWRIINDPETPASARVAAMALESKRYIEYSEKHEGRIEHGVVYRRTPSLIEGEVMRGEGET